MGRIILVVFCFLLLEQRSAVAAGNGKVASCLVVVIALHLHAVVLIVAQEGEEEGKRKGYRSSEHAPGQSPPDAPVQ